MNRQEKKTAVAALSVASNSALVVLKLVVGLLIGSVSVISEAIHSGVDLVAAVIAFFAVKTSGKPADRTHHYGHSKVENIAGTTEALLIFLAAGWIIYEAVYKLLHPSPLEEVSWGIAVMLASACANMAVSHMLFKVGRETESIALQADGWHLRTDVYTSLGVMAGLLLYWAGRKIFPGMGLSWIDPAAAIVVALLILKAAYELTRDSVRDLLDASLPTDEERLIRAAIKDLYPRIYGFHNLRTRKSGHHRFVELHLKVDAGLSVEASHAISKELEDNIRAQFPEARVIVHIEPCDRTCKASCLSNCFIKAEIKAVE